MESADKTTFMEWFVFINAVVSIIDLVSISLSPKYGDYNGNVLLSYTIRGVILRTFTVRPIVIFIIMIIVKVLLIIINA